MFVYSFAKLSFIKMTSFLLLTGMPGCGKTTIVQKLVADLSKVQKMSKVQGFFTEEVRNTNRERIGFDIVTLDGKRCPLSRVR